VMEELSPAERVALVLHDVFDFPFARIAEVLGGTPAASRKLASRARKRVAAAEKRPRASRAETARVLEAFKAAADAGDLAGLVELLHPEAVYVADGGGKVTAARRPVTGAQRIAVLVARQFDMRRPDGFRIIAPSRFGYLGSALPAGASPARQADAFAALLDKLGIEKTAVVAASAGATSALQLAIRHPERVSALVLVSPNGPGCQHDQPPMPRAVASAFWRSERLMWLARRRFTARLLRMMGVHKTPGEADRDRVDAELDGIFPVTERVDGALFDAFVSNPDINHGYEFGRVAAPTLIVHARDDALVPCWAAIALAQSIPGARLHVLEDGGGHLMLGDHPEVATEISAQLRSTRSTPD